MIIPLTQEERRELLKAVGNGRLDTSTIPRIADMFADPYSQMTDEELDNEIRELMRKLDITPNKPF
ncbi:MAG: hypothetical protein K2J82_09365 [Muribaculaceae bacterium]|nr:hypothetical protein [Muribaculaceae bacterium]